jgi:hypothetical protein
LTKTCGFQKFASKKSSCPPGFSSDACAKVLSVAVVADDRGADDVVERLLRKLVQALDERGIRVRAASARSSSANAGSNTTAVMGTRP